MAHVTLCGCRTNFTAVMDYLEKILNARSTTSPSKRRSTRHRILSARIGNRVFLKREDMQPVFSFKLRGAYNKIANLTPEQRSSAA
jgi:threonine dehydratase